MHRITGPTYQFFCYLSLAFAFGVATVLLALFMVEPDEVWLKPLREPLPFFTLAGAVYFLAYAGPPAWRAFLLAQHRRRPELLAQRMADLRSPSLQARRKAVQLLADYAGHPFGAVSCWPAHWSGTQQFELLLVLYREWWEHHQARQRGETLSEFVRSRSPALASAGRGAFLREGSDIAETTLGEKLPPLVEDQFVELMRGRVEQALREVAQTINKAGDGALVAAGEETVRCVFAELLWDALEQALQLRLKARWLPPQTAPSPAIVERPRGRAGQAMERADDAIRDAVLDLDLTGEERAPKPPPVPLPPLGPAVLVAELRERIEEALVRIAEALNAAPDAPALAATEVDVRPLLEELLSEAVARYEELRIDAALAGLPPAVEGSWRQKYRRMKAAEGDWPREPMPTPAPGPHQRACPKGGTRAPGGGPV